jgi:hypothetical protein
MSVCRFTNMTFVAYRSTLPGAMLFTRTPCACAALHKKNRGVPQ